MNRICRPGQAFRPVAQACSLLYRRLPACWSSEREQSRLNGGRSLWMVMRIAGSRGQQAASLRYSRLQACATVVATCFLAFSAAAATNDPATLLQKGLFEEEANHNFSNAIHLYQSLISNFDNDRKLAATAIFRLGECYRKQGKTNEATAQYERVLREFPDQTQLTAAATQNLAALGTSKTEVAGTETIQSDRDRANAQARALKAQFERLKGFPKDEQRIAIQQEFPNPVMTALMQQLQETEQTLATLSKKFTPEHPEVLATLSRKDTITAQIDAQVKTTLTLLLSKSDEAAKGAEVLGKLSDRATAEKQNGVPEPSTNAEAEEVRRISAMIKDSPDLINARDSSGEAPLHKAAWLGQLSVAKFLIENGADVELRSGRGYTPLHCAAAEGHKAVCEMLLDHHAQVNAKDSSGATPLHAASQKGFRSVAELLIARGANVSAKDNDGKTPLHSAVANKFKSIAELLITKGADPNAATTSSFETPLHFAVKNGDKTLTELVLGNRANPNAARYDGMTPLDDAATSGNIDLGQLLLKNGAAVNATNRNPNSLGWTALHYAVMANEPKFVSLLLESHADSNARISSGFQVASMNRQPRLPGQPSVELSGYTPLTMACAQAFPEVVQALLIGKANPDMRTAAGDPPLSLCVEPQITAVSFPAPGVRAARDDDNALRCFKLLLEAAVNIEAPDSAGRTPLLRIADYGTIPFLEALLTRHPNLQARGKGGETALHKLASRAAAMSLNNSRQAASPMAELLINAGADVNAQNEHGQTPLEITLHSNFNSADKNEFAQVLRAAGATADMDTIRIRRPGSDYELAVFKKGTNNFNSFTLFELLAAHYGYISTDLTKNAFNQQGTQLFVSLANAGAGRSRLAVARDALKFPELDHLIIRRTRPNQTTVAVHAAALLSSAAAVSGECRDMQLEWGDVVEIPEADHQVANPWPGLNEHARVALEK